jgi:pyruvate kinase
MRELDWQHTKVVCTLGPATDGPGVLEALIRAGMDVARINLSHGVPEEHARRIRQVRELGRKLGRPLGILADLPGPKIRLGSLRGGSVTLEDGARVQLASNANGSGALPIRQPEMLAALRPGQTVYLADGMIRLVVEGSAPGRVRCVVSAGGTVRTGSGVNVPELDLPALVPTENDKALLRFAVGEAIDWIGVSFVQGADDLSRVRDCLTGARKPLLMAKIERRRALLELEAIVEAADGVMVARGDLGVETDLAEIPLLQKRIIAASNAKARPVVTATQMLESMVQHEYPTRAEVSDIANAVLDGTDAVMLSAESAIGRYPVDAVGVLRRVIAATLAEHAAPMAHARLRASAAVAPDEAVAFAACQLAERVDACAIIAEVQHVSQVAALARFRPRAPIVVLARSSSACEALTLIAGVAPVLASTASEAVAQDWLYGHSLGRPGAQAVLVSASGAGGVADTLRVVRLRKPGGAA